MSPLAFTEKPSFQANIGGAPLNMLSALAKWGKNTTFIGKVGDDVFGKQIKQELHTLNIDTHAIQVAEREKTTLTFVTLQADGERSFDFYRSPGADQLLQPSELNPDMFTQNTVFHHGSLSLSHEPSRGATFQALALAEKNEMLISYDPNIRLGLWESSDEARQIILEAMSYTDILKVSEEELLFLTEETTVSQAIQHLRAIHNIPLIFVTFGAKGCYYYGTHGNGYVSAFKVNAIDSTGAGDAFMAGILYGILENSKSIHYIQDEELQKIAAFANYVAGQTTTQSGGFNVVPSLEEIPAVYQTKSIESE